MSNRRSMEVIEPRMTQAGQARMMVRLSEQYSQPMLALKEYVTNAIDAYDLAAMRSGLVHILADPANKTLIVRDGGPGMDEARMRRLPVEIGESEKYEQPDQRGEIAVGLLSFGTLGGQMHLLSKTQKDGWCNYLRWEKRKDRIATSFARVSPREMDDLFYGHFSQGTRVIIDTSPYILKDKLPVGTIRRELQKIYLPLLVSGRFGFEVGKIGESERLEAPKKKGEQIQKPNVPIRFRAKQKGVMRDFSFFADLWLDLDDSGGRVSMHSKDVLIYNALTLMDREFTGDELWKCRQVSGNINEPNLSVTLGREAIAKSKETNVYKAFVEALHGLSDRLWPQISDRITQRRVETQNKLLNDITDIFSEAYQKGEPLNKKRRGPRKKKPERKRNGGGQGGEIPPRKFPFAFIPSGFELLEMGLRSKLEYDTGVPTIVVNDLHPNYRQHVSNGATPEEKTHYLIDVIRTQIALHEMREALEMGKHFGNGLEVAAAVAARADDLKFSALEVLASQ